MKNLELNTMIKESWKKISPFWPLKNLIAVNPLQGSEDLPFESALLEGLAYFQQEDFPKPMEAVNRETIKWLQAFFDDAEATIQMPLRAEGLYASWRQLVCFDVQLHENDAKKKQWLSGLPKSSELVIAECLLRLTIPRDEQLLFLTLLLTTLPGWASHIKYRTDWTDGETKHSWPVTQSDYLAVRLVITCLLWEEAQELLVWHKKAREEANAQPSSLERIKKAEAEYQLPLLDLLVSQTMDKSCIPDIQLLFCIDVRSEPFRRALELEGNYETFGVTGFFGVPVSIENSITQESYASCPVLLTPQHTVKGSLDCSDIDRKNDYDKYTQLIALKRLYQMFKYNFITSFILVEILGFISGVWMGLKSCVPKFAMRLKTGITQWIRPKVSVVFSLENISFEDQCAYAEGVLRIIGLTKNFAPMVVLCGHSSSTQNNAFATSLDCGACGGNKGSYNARILVAILNNKRVRDYLYKKNITIPESTQFVAAKHDTTTDAVEIYLEDECDVAMIQRVQKLKKDLESVRKINSQSRAKQMGFQGTKDESAAYTNLCSIDWAQVRPESVLARNASFIVAPRNVTKNRDLKGRAFLHSYDYSQDVDGKLLTSILTAPMVVAQWINAQYLFSTLDNVAYGAGSKVTRNITGKIGIMQGNASDLMHGLPLQSVYSSDTQAYHPPVRLMTVVYAPRILIDKIIQEQEVLKKLFGNGWVTLACIEPETNSYYLLQRDFTWK